MEVKQLFETIGEIKKANPENLMARHFDESYYLSLSESGREHLLQIIATGLENPDSQMGAYALESNDYERFAPFFDLLIRDFHHLSPDQPIAQPSDWNVDAPWCDLKDIDPTLGDVSMRVRVARNLSGFPMPARMSMEQRLAFEAQAVELFAVLLDHPGFGGSYLSLSPGSPHMISTEEYQKRVASHQMFKDMRDDKYLETAGISAHWPHGRGMYISRDEDFLIWVGEEDHFRIMAMRTGSKLNELFLRLSAGLNLLEEDLRKNSSSDFVISPTYGAVTSCPTNLGAGMRASLHMKLPNLSKIGTDLSKLKSLASPLGLALRGASGEHSDTGAGGLADISPMARLGVSEKQIMVRLFEGTKALWGAEVSAQA